MDIVLGEQEFIGTGRVSLGLEVLQDQSRWMIQLYLSGCKNKQQLSYF